VRMGPTRFKIPQVYRVCNFGHMGSVWMEIGMVMT
jgi:hypothetical protein